MKKKLLIATGLLVAAIAVLFGYAAMQPKQMMIAREILIQAPPEVIFPHINHSKRMNDWMPWKDSDPGAKMTYSGPEEGVGAISAWDSDGDMGTGQAEIVESVANQVVKTQLTYTKPMVMSQLAAITLTPAAGGTLVRWSVSGESPIVCRVFCIFLNMDEMVGKEFEKGLANLKRTVEGGTPTKG